jgi:putative flippase GtrA
MAALREGQAQPGAPAHAARRGARVAAFISQCLRFVLVGLTNAVVDLGVLNLLLILHPTSDRLGLLAYNTLAVAAAILNSYVWNARWTFRATATGSRRERALFVAQALVNVAVNNLVLLGIVDLDPVPVGPLYLLVSNAAKLGAMVAAATTSYVLLRVVVFRGR